MRSYTWSELATPEAQDTVQGIYALWAYNSLMRNGTHTDQHPIHVGPVVPRIEQQRILVSVPDSQPYTESRSPREVVVYSIMAWSHDIKHLMLLHIEGYDYLFICHEALGLKTYILLDYYGKTQAAEYQ